MNPSDPENAVAAFLDFRAEVREAGLHLSDSDIITLMVAERLNVIARHLDREPE